MLLVWVCSVSAACNTSHMTGELTQFQHITNSAPILQLQTLGMWWGFALGLGFGVGVGVWTMGCPSLGTGTGFRSVARVTVHSNCA